MPGVSTMTRPCFSNGLWHDDLDPIDLLVVAGVADLADPLVQVVDGDVLDDRRVVRLARLGLAAHDGTRLVAAAHEGDRRGGEVVIDRAHVLAEQRVDRANSCPA